MSVKRKIVCDGPLCEEIKDSNSLLFEPQYGPHDWWGALLINLEDTKHFCSEECFMNWFKGEYGID